MVVTGSSYWPYIGASIVSGSYLYGSGSSWGESIVKKEVKVKKKEVKFSMINTLDEEI